MFEIALFIAPIFALLILGHLLRRGGIPSFEFWNLNNKLVYWVLMPSLLFYKTSTTPIDSAMIGSFAVVVLGAFACAIVFGVLVWKFSGLPAPTSSSVLQGSARHNTFIALAVAERLYGSEGLALATLASAMLIPATNLSVVSLMVVMNSAPTGRHILPAIFRDLARNPLLISVIAGLACNFLYSSELPLVHDMTRILGQAALPIMLLSVGASLRIRAMSATVVPVALAILGKMLLFPLIAFYLAQAIELSEVQTVIAVIFAAAPTASAGYTLAQEMGGDAPVMAAIVTVQTGLSFLTIPFTIILTQMTFS